MIRRAACTLGALALVAPAVIGLSATAAFAEGSFTSPTPDNGSALASTSFQVKAATTKKGTSVTLQGPGGYSASRASSTALGASTNQTVTLDAVDASKYPNGTWTAKVSSGESRTFYSNFAPATPSGFSADTTEGDAHEVFLQWAKGAEPDLLGYTLYDGDGNVLVQNITASSACSGSTCSYAPYYDNPKPGTYSYTYRLSALRSGGSPGVSTVESAKTSTRTASLTTPVPPPSPTPTPSQGPSGGGTTGGTTNGSTGGGTTGGGTTTGGSSTGSSTGGSSVTTGGTKTSSSPAALPTLDPIAIQKRAFAYGFNSFGASLGIPKLPPLPNTSPQLPSGTGALPLGTYQPKLPYQSQSETTKTTSFISNPIGSITSIDPHKLYPMIAFSLILIMSAAHLRRWVGAHVEE